MVMFGTIGCRATSRGSGSESHLQRVFQPKWTSSGRIGEVACQSIGFEISLNLRTTLIGSGRDEGLSSGLVAGLMEVVANRELCGGIVREFADLEER